MLKPKNNRYRDLMDLSGVWEFKVDSSNEGESKNWFDELDADLSIAVPGSWNEQLEADGLMHYIGTAWYSKNFFLPSNYENKKVWVRVGCADFYSKVWINGKYLGENLGGYLPFDFELTDFVNFGLDNTLTLLVNNELNSDTIPQGITSEDYHKEKRLREETYPPARFDFSPYGGIQRPVFIYSTPADFIDDIRVDTAIKSKDGVVKVNVKTNTDKELVGRVTIQGDDSITSCTAPIKNKLGKCEIFVSNCRLWSTEDPFLYDLKVELTDNNEVVDVYSTEFGIREVKVDGYKILLNGKEVFLKGFGKHEDFPVLGKAFNWAVIVKDFSLMKWMNANSFRTSHYPYAEEWIEYADRNGFLVIDEVPAVSLDFRKVTDKTLKNHKEFLRKLIERDKNHPSVIMWATGNEPNLVGEPTYYEGSGDRYWKEIYEYTKSLDDSRPTTIPNCQRAGTDDPVFKYSDVCSINRYYGWYENPGHLETAVKRMEEEMDTIAEKYGKPIFVTEFGTDTMPGMHSVAEQMFTEEYQSQFLKMYCDLIESKEYCIGEHVWNFADFKTPQHFRRVVVNLKGVFTRDRNPKSSAFVLKEIWSKIK